MPELSGTASAAVRDVLDAPRAAARVIAAFPAAVYLEVAGTPRVVALVSRHGVVLPNAVVVEDLVWAADLGPAAAATIGDGAVDLDGTRVIADRTWYPAVVLPTDADLPARLARMEAATSAPEGAHAEQLLAGTRRLVAVLAARDVAAAFDVASMLLGLGPGLTPSGDDILAGALAAGRAAARAVRHVAGDAWLADFGAQVAMLAPGRTTTLSASLLWHAARGEVAEPARHVLRALGGQTPLEPALAALLRVGHSSGRDLAAGLAVGLRAVLGWTPTAGLLAETET